MRIKSYTFMTGLILQNKEFERFFTNKINQTDISLRETKAYIQGIFTSYIRSENDLSKESITLQYIEANSRYDFAQFQNLADWVFFIRTVYPDSIKASPEYYNAIAQCSYYRCYIIMDRQWRCFEELADRFDYFVENIRFLSHSTLS